MDKESIVKSCKLLIESVKRRIETSRCIGGMDLLIDIPQDHNRKRRMEPMQRKRATSPMMSPLEVAVRQFIFLGLPIFRVSGGLDGRVESKLE